MTQDLRSFFISQTLWGSLLLAAPLSPQMCIAQETPSKLSTTKDSLDSISDWGHAGVLWSETHFTRRMAIEAGRRSNDGDYQKEMNELIEQCNRLIQSLESFGWRQIAISQTGPSPTTAAMKEPIAGSVQNMPLPSATAAASELAQELGVDRVPVVNSNTADVRSARPERQTSNNLPGQAEIVAPSDRDSIAGAIEDGIDGAVAAGIGRLGPRDPAGQISRREGWTLSDTLPYSRDSIYDADDYDPNVDYRSESAILPDSDQNGALNRTPNDNGRDADNYYPAAPPTALAEESPNVQPTRIVPQIDRPRSSPNLDWRRFADEENSVAADAAWVTLHLRAKQHEFSMLQPSLDEMSEGERRTLVSSAKVHLRATAYAISRNNRSDDRIDQIMQQVP